MPDLDQDIIALIRVENSRRYGFDLLVKTYQEKLYWVIRRVLISHAETDDVLQDVLIKVWENISAFKGDAKLYTWLYRIAVNETLMALRKKRRRFFIPIVDVEKELEAELECGDGFTGDEIQLKLQKAILTLPQKQRLVFLLKYFDDLKFADISVIMGVSIGGLKAQYHHAVKKIKKTLELD